MGIRIVDCDKEEVTLSDGRRISLADIVLHPEVDVTWYSSNVFDVWIDGKCFIKEMLTELGEPVWGSSSLSVFSYLDLYYISNLRSLHNIWYQNKTGGMTKESLSEIDSLSQDGAILMFWYYSALLHFKKKYKVSVIELSGIDNFGYRLTFSSKIEAGYIFYGSCFYNNISEPLSMYLGEGVTVRSYTGNTVTVKAKRYVPVSELAKQAILRNRG